MKNYIELLLNIKHSKLYKLLKFIPTNTLFKIEGYKKNIYFTILNDKSIMIFNGEKDLFSQISLNDSPDSFFKLNAYKVVFNDSLRYLNKKEKEKLKKRNISFKILILRLEAGQYPKTVCGKDALFLINILESILKIINYYKNSNLKIDDNDYILSFNLKNSIKVKKVNTPSITFKYPIQNKLNEHLVNKAFLINKCGIINIGLFYSPFYINDTKEFPYMIFINDETNNIIFDILFIEKKNYKNISNIVFKSLLEKHIIPEYISFNNNEALITCSRIINKYNLKYRVIDNKLQNEQWINLKNKLK